MSELKLFLDDLNEESLNLDENAKAINEMINGSFIESGSHRVFVHEKIISSTKNYNLTDSLPSIPNWLYKYCKIFNIASPQEIIFLDTETTGLDRGANTYAFLTGVLYFDNNNWILKQFFIESPENENLMIEILAKLLSKFKILVSYNGKCYDIPLLDSRFKYHQNKYSIRDLEFLDLLHLSRRFWKPALQGCKLQNIETLIFNYIRDYSNDIPGELIPKAYFDYLASRNAEEISSVFYHNEEDLYSLTKILEVCANLDFMDSAYLDKFKIDSYSVAKFLVDIGLEQLSLPLLKDLAKRGEVSENILLLLTKLLKKKEDFVSAVEYLKLMETSSPLICLEMSKIHEHKLKDLSQAFYYARKAYLQLHEASIFDEVLIAESEKRISRLKKKISG